jgi:putative transposase
MPWGLTRFHHCGQSHCVTFCCYHRRRLFTADASRQIFESAFERVRRSFRLQVYGVRSHARTYSRPAQRTTTGYASRWAESLKQGVSRRLIGHAEHFWQKKYYDFNIRNYPQFVEKLRYIHENPVKAGLCERPEDWEFRHYVTGCEGRVEIESEWTARNANERQESFVLLRNWPTQAKKRLEWATRPNETTRMWILSRDAGNNSARSS